MLHLLTTLRCEDCGFSEAGIVHRRDGSSRFVDLECPHCGGAFMQPDGSSHMLPNDHPLVLDYTILHFLARRTMH